MKIYAVVVDDIFEGSSGDEPVHLFFSKKKASEKLEELYRSGKECYQGQYDTFKHEKGKSFSMFNMGWHMDSHYDARVIEVEVQGEPEACLKLDVVFGKEAAEKAMAVGFKKTKLSIKRGGTQGDFDTYAFSSENDRKEAIRLLQDYNNTCAEDAYWEKTPKDND